jgi:glycosyltransferase involved in cell wall biosynthesis
MACAVKILHIAETIKGGIASYLNQVIPELDLRLLNGELPEQLVMVPDADTRYLPWVRPEKLLPFSRRHGRNPFELARFAIAARRNIVATKPDIVFLHSTFAGALVRAQWPIRGSDAKIVYCAHGPAYDAPRAPILNRLIKRMERDFSFRTDRIIALSDIEAAECVGIGFPCSRVARVYNGITLGSPQAKPAAWNTDRLKILFIGRFDRQKGIDTLFKAATLTPEKLSIRCAGDAVVSRGKLPPVPDNVSLLGWLDPEQLQAQLLATDIVVMPSRWEGLGIAAIEAMRAGKPIVASAVGGLRELIVHGETGWLVPPDNPAALLAALLRPTAKERVAAGEAGRTRFKQMFTIHHCVDGLQHELQRVLDAPRVAATNGGAS